MRRRSAAAAATPLRRALHAAAVTCASVALGAGTTLLGANAVEATGIGLATLPVVTTFFPVPPRGTRTGRQIASGVQDSKVIDQTGASVTGADGSPAAPMGEDAKEASAPARHTPAATGSPAVAAADAGTGAVNPAVADETGYDAVMIWEPRLQIKPRVTVFPAHIEEENTASPAPVPPPVPDTGTDATSGNES
ncbi:hypothetical protein ACFYY2_32110 [Streptomyces sp. NPDC001822]|uniref:hypothetical protein n=1 Tax=Streptomyces sp. NPDC001822 TaxID=3364614 RepID=UPI003688EB5F